LEPDNLPLVLMADDDEDDCMLARDAFNVSGIPGLIHFVGDGIDLLRYLSGPEASPAVILLDLNMPRKDGRQALTEIKSTPGIRNIPVVVLTTSREDDDRYYCNEKGVHSFITKPASFSEWVDIMRSLANTWLVAR
jgi:CheY-like chemotaxis protein